MSTVIPCWQPNGCPHGPYGYRVHRDGKKLKQEYIGPVDSFSQEAEEAGPGRPVAALGAVI